MTNNKIDLLEYGQVARTKIGKYTLIKNFIAINKAMAADNNYKFIYCNGSFYEPQQYTVTKYGNNKYISEIKFIRYL